MSLRIKGNECGARDWPPNTLRRAHGPGWDDPTRVGGCGEGVEHPGGAGGTQGSRVG
jgi:hypothetical protein